MSDHQTPNEGMIDTRPEEPNLTRRLLVSSAGLGLAGIATIGVAGTAMANTMNPQPSAAEDAQGGRFSGQVVLITGATSGIGEATAKAFAAEGARVTFCGRRAELGAAVEKAIRDAGGEAAYVQADVRDAAQMERFVKGAAKRFGRIDIAFNNAGVFMPPKELQDLTVEEYLDLINTNLNGVAYAMMYEIPIMRAQGAGVIVNMASVAGHKGFANTPHYNASKHGVIGLTKATAAGNAKHNIRIVSLSPLAVDTPMLRIKDGKIVEAQNFLTDMHESDAFFWAQYPMKPLPDRLAGDAGQ